MAATSRCAVVLYWLPLGAGDGARCVRLSGQVFEAVVAARHHRDRHPLFHSALQVRTGADRVVVEMGPVWSLDVPDRGVVCEGAVGATWLGRSRLFRYEVRCWPDGVLPDEEFAVGGPVDVPTTEARTNRLLELVAQVPTATWGRDEQATGEMWNSNSVVAWLLVRAGLDASRLHPPAGGRAPGWDAGVAAAQIQLGNHIRHRHSS